MTKRAVLALADGTTFEGRAFGAVGETVGEVVFNTTMYGYQEVLTDPSYVGQIVTMSYPEIGNVGANPEDEEGSRVHAVGMVVRALSEQPSNWRAKESLDAYLKRNGVAGIEGIDTRRLVRHLRTHGAQMGVISSEGLSPLALVERARSARGMEGLDLATGVSTKEAYTFTQPSPDVFTGLGEVRVPAEPRFDVVAYDYGLKKSMLHFLVDVGCRVTVVPANTSAEEVLARKPNGVFLANGPGDPAAVKGADRTVAALLGKVPVFGICLGHQIMALALGGRTYKMKFGHRGGNQPVKDLTTGKVEITAQNHGFAVDDASLKGLAVVTHINLNDGTVEGLAVPDARAFSVQYHPEASPGPHDARYLFDRFAKLMAG
ncbi:carbamoyl-phosphate synthase, small subunit [Myxococcus xanthus DK 1622]|uniref:Carbamoyl phosphate synthase small chain n=1 Tax=Myxococcus xanthus (strain DK1622) TaxID=246197 RepID=Q1D6L7_MYXXD|nr:MULTISPECIES: glutamine-hydrolyzing carbamoyl-phosphate synthase small subunit [Myxococcus]ABF91170.1 carbamoyl-phosphate synthase, small subunit [Myxococcus xanthus DK 1622]NOJ51971.1 glutamine-hydrolyzing carbamoyl-phosphate synthase small subunit [Myxococcus xanthus]QPM82929.1 glutamine-hydrolyzing carbamoyl-phosphate synthase small subunit [Myxococcus xanthus]QVW65235.1 glutamine-hydrolyzing carbamoyl-phosphate synthase small subunit [Myxococcus xanthus DZ2]QZZ51208.1 Carbamoyl-phosphat